MKVTLEPRAVGEEGASLLVTRGKSGPGRGKSKEGKGPEAGRSLLHWEQR